MDAAEASAATLQRLLTWLPAHHPRLTDASAEETKRILRAFGGVVESLSHHGASECQFPARRTTNPARYRYFVDKLVPVLSLSGLTINSEGKVCMTSIIDGTILQIIDGIGQYFTFDLRTCSGFKCQEGEQSVPRWMQNRAHQLSSGKRSSTGSPSIIDNWWNGL